MTRAQSCWLALLVSLFLAGSAAAVEDDASGWTSLFNGKDLSGWTRYLSPKVTDGDPDKIWTVKDGVLLCEGSIPGYLLTEKVYENYVLRLQWRWGEKPGRNGGRNSGVFVHTVGPNKIWPKGVEAQLMSQHAGDFWLVGGAKLEVDAERQDPKVSRHYFRMKGNVEEPLGEWNQYEITCRGDRIELVVNGHLVNVGTESELTKGRILLQSEGSEIHFRNIELKPLED